MKNMIEIYDERLQSAKNVVSDISDLISTMEDDEFYKKITGDNSYLDQSVLGKARRWVLENHYLNLPTGHILDAGCGVGGWSYRLRDMGNEVTGIEKSLEKYLFLLKLHEKFPTSLIKFIHGNIHNMPFSDRWFDACDSCMVIEHLRNPRVGLREMKRVAKSVTGIIHMGKSREDNPYHLWFMNEERTKELLNEAFGIGNYNFEVIDEIIYICFSAIVPYQHEGKKLREVYAEDRYDTFNKTDCTIVDRESAMVPIDAIDVNMKGDIRHLQSRQQELIENFTSIIDMGKVNFFEDPFLPIHLIRWVGSEHYQIFEDGWHRTVALKMMSHKVKEIRASVTIVEN